MTQRRPSPIHTVAPAGDVDRLVIDDPEAGVFRVHRRIFMDPDIAAEEQSRIFARCWIYAGHESEIAAAGDFRTRDVAGRPMILARDADGRVRVYLNTCRHMGSL